MAFSVFFTKKGEESLSINRLKAPSLKPYFRKRALILYVSIVNISTRLPEIFLCNQ